MAVSPELAAIIQAFKNTDLPGTAIGVIEDDAAKRLLAQWPLFPIRFAPPAGDPPEDPAERWDWLWSEVELDLDELAARAGVESFATRFKFPALRANRLIYPDGTIADWAEKILAAEVVSWVRRIRKRNGQSLALGVPQPRE